MLSRGQTLRLLVPSANQKKFYSIEQSKVHPHNFVPSTFLAIFHQNKKEADRGIQQTSYDYLTIILTLWVLNNKNPVL